jgi:UDP-N-acetylglucosamine acyltransferase
MHKSLYRQQLTLAQAQSEIELLTHKYPEAKADVDMMLGFLQGASPERGIVR